MLLCRSQVSGLAVTAAAARPGGSWRAGTARRRGSAHTGKRGRGFISRDRTGAVGPRPALGGGPAATRAARAEELPGPPRGRVS